MPEVGTKKVQYLVGSTESLFYSPVSVICFKKDSQFKTNTYNKNTTANITRFELHPYENKTVTYTLQFPRLKKSSQLTSMGEQKHFSRCPQHLIRVSNIYQTEWPHQILKMAIILADYSITVEKLKHILRLLTIYLNSESWKAKTQEKRQNSPSHLRSSVSRNISFDHETLRRCPIGNTCVTIHTEIQRGKKRASW